MSFLANKLKLEVKSLQNSNLASFTSTSKNTNIHIIPEDSSNFYTVIGSSSVNSSIESFITLCNDNIHHKVATFQENNINFGTDTLLKGNLIVLGSVISLGYDILTKENRFILNNYGSSAEKGLNSVSQETLRVLSKDIEDTSNIFIDRINSNFIDIENLIGLSNLFSFRNDVYTEIDFNRSLEKKTLDEVLQGTSNKFIANNEYNSLDHLNISGPIFSSNILAESLNIYGNLYTPFLYGDGSSILKINRSFMNTNNILEGSNLYFTNDRVGSLAFSNTEMMSNTLYGIDSSLQEVFDMKDILMSNYIINFLFSIKDDNISSFEKTSNDVSLINNSFYEKFTVLSSNFHDYLDNSLENISNMIVKDSENTYNFLFDNSNIIVSKIRYYIDNVSNDILNISNQLYFDMDNFIINENEIIDQSSNILNIYINEMNNDTSNFLKDTDRRLLFDIVVWNQTIKEFLSNMSNKLLSTLVLNELNTSNYINDSMQILHTELNNSNENIQTLSDNNFKYNTSNILEENINFSNIIKKNYESFVYNMETDHNKIMNEIKDTSNVNILTFDNIKSIQELSNEKNNLHIQNISNQLIYFVRDINSSNSQNINQEINARNSDLSNTLQTLTTTDIAQGSINLYFSSDLFNSSINTKSLENINNISTSNSIIINNIYDNNLEVKGDISAMNAEIEKIISRKINTYNTERLEIINNSNEVALLLKQFNKNDIIDLSNDVHNLFILTGEGNIGIKKNPTTDLDINGTFKADFLKGSGKFLENINLYDRSTDDLSESINSNLYYTDYRASKIINSSNKNISNYIDNVYGKIRPLIDNFDTNISNYIAKEFKFNSNLIVNSSINNSNYINNISNLISSAINLNNISLSNYIAFNSNQITIDESNSLGNQSNYTRDLLDSININYNNSFISNSYITTFSQISNLNDIQSNYVNSMSNILVKTRDEQYLNNSNTILNMSNYFRNKINDSNFVFATSNNISKYIDSINHDQVIQIYSINSNILDSVNIKINNIDNFYNTGESITYRYTYDYNLLHINFKDIKILNKISTNNFRLINNNSNITDIYPVIDNFNLYNTNVSYLSTNSYAISSTSNVSIMMNDIFSLKKFMTAINNTVFGIHFVFNTISTQNTPIYSLGNNSKIYINIKISYGIIYFIIGNDGNGSDLQFYAEKIISPNVWYIIDIICDINSNDNFVGCSIYINAEKQLIKIMPSLEPEIIGSSIVMINENTSYSAFTSTIGPNRITFTQDTLCDILIVGGGGGGGARFGGGGGAGGVSYYTNITLNAGIYDIIVGDGGAGGVASGSTGTSGAGQGSNGGDSYIQRNFLDIYRSKGGGGGGRGDTGNGSSGGSGGGAAGRFNGIGGNAIQGNTNNSLVGGYSGGNYNGTSIFYGGGGGGAGGAGGNTGDGPVGNGGIGIQNSITGIAKFYAGGGGGGCDINGTTQVIALGGSGIGGNGGGTSTYNLPTNGLANTGSGGGGSSATSIVYNANFSGAKGGSGIVIIKWTQFANLQNTQGMTWGTYNNNLAYSINSNISMYIGVNNNYDILSYDYRSYLNGAVFTNTYFSSNSYIKPGFLAPIIRRSAHDYSSYSNLIYSSYYASNYDYQYSGNISSVNVIGSYFDNADTRLLIGDRGVNSMNFVFTEIEANVKLIEGYYIFMLDLQNEVSADLLIGKHTDKNIDSYVNVANYYNSNLLNTPVSSITDNSNMVLDRSIYIPAGYYRFYMRMLRHISNRNNNYLIAKYYYSNTSNSSNYTLNNSNLYIRYSNYNSLNTLYKTGSLSMNNLLYINNDTIRATSNLYRYTYGGGTTINVSNYNYDINHSNINSFFSGISSNNLRLQDFRIYSTDSRESVIDNISNVLYYGKMNYSTSYSSNVLIKPVRWTESSSYSCNYYNDFSRYITYTDISNIGISIGKSTEPEATLDIYTEDPSLYSIKTNNPIWVQSGVVMSSDIRIKKNIRDINDNSALSQIMSIEPKTYNYIEGNRSSDNVIGFIAQQIRDVIPNAITLNYEMIPNIYCKGNMIDNCIYLENFTDDISNKIALNSIIIIEINNVRYAEYIVEIFNKSSFKIANKNRLVNSSVFVYGTYVNDYHALDKNYIYTLSVCATQDIHRIQRELLNNVDIIDNNSLSNISRTYSSIINDTSSNIVNINDNLSLLIQESKEIGEINHKIEYTLETIDCDINGYEIDVLKTTSNTISSLLNDINNIIVKNDIILEINKIIIDKNQSIISNMSMIETSIENIHGVLLRNNIS